MIYLILILALALRLVSLNQSLWLDEATSVIVARDMSFGQILTQFSPGDFHPPLYYLLLKAWVDMFGSSEVAVRSLSILAGVATVFVVYFIGKNVANRKVGLLGAALLATSGLHIYYSQEVRMYSLAAFFIALSVYFFARISKKARLGVTSARQGRVGEWVGFATSLALAGLTHYLTLLILPVFWLSGFFAAKKPSWWKNFFKSHIILVIAGILWWPTFLKQFGGSLGIEAGVPAWWQVLGKTSAREILLVPAKFILGRINLTDKTLYGFLVISIGAGFAYLFVRAAESLKKSRLIWLWLVVPIVSAAVIGFKIPVFSYFRLLFVLPAFYLLLAQGAAGLKPRWQKAAIIFILAVNLVSSGAYLFNPRFHREDWKGLVAFVEQEKRDKKAITLFVADSQMEAYRFYAPDAKISGPAGLSGEYDQVWLMRYVAPIFDPKDTLRQEVERVGYLKAGEYDFNEVVVWRYEK